MFMRLMAFLLMFLVPYSFASADATTDAARGQKTVSGEGIVVAVSDSVAPYASQRGMGLLCDVMRESLSASGLAMETRFYSNQRALDLYRRGEIDAVAIGNDAYNDAYSSESYIQFRNFAISLAEKPLNIKSVKDLQGKRVVAFSRAYDFLGSAFREAVSDNDSYRELDHQRDQVLALLHGESDVAIADARIFNYYFRTLQRQYPADETLQKTLVFHPIFAPSNYRAMFRDADVRDAFNRGYRKIVDNGTLDSIYARYHRLYRQFAPRFAAEVMPLDRPI